MWFNLNKSLKSGKIENVLLNKRLFSGISVVIFLLGVSLKNGVIINIGVALILIYACYCIYFVIKIWRIRKEIFANKKLFYFSLSESIFSCYSL